VSLIEKASRRLEELKRAGVEFADGLEEAATPPAAADATPARNGELREARHVVPPAPAAAARSRAGSRQVAIDLARLAADGYVTPDAPHSPIANEFRVIKRPVIENARGKAGSRARNANLVMVTSALQGEGKSFTAINIAMSIATELDSTVLLVDADVANPSLLEALGLPQSTGLLDALREPELDLADLLLRTNVEKLSILPAGPRHPRATELLASDAMTRLVEELANRYPDRIVIFDSPPLLLTTESPVLAAHMGQILVVVEAERTTASVLKHALTTIEKCPIVMTMLNKARASEIGSYYGYGYGQRAREGQLKDGE